MKFQKGLKLIWLVLSDPAASKESKLEALRHLGEMSQTEEPRRTKNMEGNKWDGDQLLGRLRGVYGNAAFWSVPEACKDLGIPSISSTLLKKILESKPPGAKKIIPRNLSLEEQEQFDAKRAEQGKPNRGGCSTFYQLMPYLSQVSEVSTARLREAT